MEVTSHKAYTKFAQMHSFQANYWRDPRFNQKQNYLSFSQLAKFNNEYNQSFNLSLQDNLCKTKMFVWVMASEDTIVWPREGEQWGAPDPEDPFRNPILN